MTVQPDTTGGKSRLKALWGANDKQIWRNAQVATWKAIPREKVTLIFKHLTFVGASSLSYSSKNFPVSLLPRETIPTELSRTQGTGEASNARYSITGTTPHCLYGSFSCHKKVQLKDPELAGNVMNADLAHTDWEKRETNSNYRQQSRSWKKIALPMNISVSKRWKYSQFLSVPITYFVNGIGICVTWIREAIPETMSAAEMMSGKRKSQL